MLTQIGKIYTYIFSVSNKHRGTTRMDEGKTLFAREGVQEKTMVVGTNKIWGGGNNRRASKLLVGPVWVQYQPT